MDLLRYAWNLEKLFRSVPQIWTCAMIVGVDMINKTILMHIVCFMLKPRLYLQDAPAAKTV